MENKKFKNRAMQRLLATSFSLLILIIFASDVQAIEYGGFGGRPAYPRPENPRTESIFVHTLELGETKDDGVLTVNNSSETKTILVYAVDSTPSTGGAFACAQISEAPHDAGAWITLEKSEVTLEPGTNEIVPFTIDIPKNASAGEHNGCIVMQEKKEKADGKSGVNLSFRTGLRVAITIPGELTRKLEIADFSVIKSDKDVISLHPVVKNTGNVSIDAEVKVVTHYFFGSTYFEHGGQYPVLRGETADWNFELKKPFWGGWYRSDFILEYDESLQAGVGVTTSETLTKLTSPGVWFFSFPTIAGLIIEIIIFLALAFIIFLFWLLQKRKKWIQKNWVKYEIELGDDINSLAKKLNTSWKLIAKTNKLRPPYALKPGEKIKVPPTK